MKWWWVRFQVWLHRERLKKAHTRAKWLSLFLWMARRSEIPRVGPYDNHPFHSTRVLSYAATFDAETIAFGDSIMDFARDDLDEIDLNMAVAGSWSHHMLRMAADVGVKRNVRYVVVGTLAGNPLLNHQEVTSVKEQALRALNGIRVLYPFAKFIVHGLPPIYDIYATIHSLDVESAIAHWCIIDQNATFLPLQKRFAGQWGVFPKTEMSSDGVHLTRLGALELNELIGRAKKSSRAILD